MKKILVITPRFPYPVIGGDRLRIFQICKELSKKYELHLVSLCENRAEMEFSTPDDGVFSSVRRVYLPRWKSYINCILALPTAKPLQVAYYSSKKFSSLVVEVSKLCDFSLSHLVRTTPYATQLSLPKVAELTDAISMNYERVATTSNRSGIKRFIYSLERKRLKAYEQEVIQSFNKTVFVSSVDKQYLCKKLPSSANKAIVCSNGVDLSSLCYNFTEGSRQIVFIGNLFSIQNFDAAEWFAREVMPSLSRLDSYTFKVIGKIRETDKKKLLRYDGVIVTGAVESVAEEAKGSLVGVCPVRLAAGVQNKILEYMALGIPCISSSIGLEGLEATIGRDIIVSDRPEEIVREIYRLSNDLTYARSVAENARLYVESHHSWNSVLRDYVDTFQGL